jgi:hypothetical protein
MTNEVLKVIKSTYDTEIMTSSAIAALLVPISQNDFALKYSNYMHTVRKGPLLQVELLYIEPSSHAKF